MYRLLVFSTLFVLGLGASIDNLPELHETFGNIYPNGRIVGGVETDISKVPYQLALEFSGRHFCGASILTPEIALTAAHCLNRLSATSMAVRTGSSKRQIGGSVHEARETMFHPNYNASTFDNDVGLVFLKTPIKLCENSKPITIIDKEPTSGSLLISGWGLLKEGTGEPSPTLMSVSVAIVNRTDCEWSYFFVTRITAKMFCAGSPGKDSCQGDSGGPAIHNGKLAGIVSFGIGCARPNFPGVYTNVAHPEVRNWIREKAKV